MDIERFKRLSIPKIEAGKMTEVVRDVIKEVRTNKQNVYEKTSEDLKPLSGEVAPNMIADMNKGFTQEELAFIQNQQLPLPADIFLQTLKQPNYEKQILDKYGEINKKLGQKKAHLSTTKANRKKNKDEIAEYTEGIDIIRKYRQRIGIVEEGAKTLKVGQGIYTQKRQMPITLTLILVFMEM